MLVIPARSKAWATRHPVPFCTLKAPKEGYSLLRFLVDSRNYLPDLLHVGFGSTNHNIKSSSGLTAPRDRLGIIDPSRARPVASYAVDGFRPFTESPLQEGIYSFFFQNGRMEGK